MIYKGYDMKCLNEVSIREKEILKMVSLEHTTKEIAEALYISAHTVISHRKNLMCKLDVKNSAGLVRKAFEQGLLSIA